MRKSAASWVFAVVTVFAPLAFLAFGVGGCASGGGGLQQPLSHHLSEKAEVKVFDYSIAKDKALCGILFVGWDPDYGVITQKVIDRAIREKGGDILVNYTTQTGAWSFLGLVTTCNVEVRGWVAKVEGYDMNRKTLDDMRAKAVPPKREVTSGDD